MRNIENQPETPSNSTPTQEGVAGNESPEERTQREAETIAKSVSPERARELEVQGATSFEDLYRMIIAWKEVEGSQRTSSAPEVVSKIERVRNGEHLKLITRAFGLRQKVSDLLRIEQIRGGLNPPGEVAKLNELNKHIESFEIGAAMDPAKYDQRLRDARAEKERLILDAAKALPNRQDLLRKRFEAYQAYNAGKQSSLRTDQMKLLRQRVEESEYEILEQARKKTTN